MNEIPSAGETFRGDDGTVSTILPTNYGQDYEASEGELDEYAEYIGIDAAKEPELMWIAQEGLRAPLPDGWRACQTDDNEVYYFNFQSGESLWDHPMDEHYKAKVIAERAKHRSGGGGRSATAAAATGGGAGSAAVRTGTTKALTDALFLKPAAASIATPLAINTKMGMSDDGASAPRAPPDVSDILGAAAGVASSPLGPPGARAGGGGAAGGPLKLKEAEAAMRRRLEEAMEAQLRALRIDFGKTEDAARQRLEEARARLQAELDTAWERERTSAPGGGGTASAATATATQRRLQTAREVKQLEESWKSRLHDVRTRVADLQGKMETQQQALQKSIHQPPEELRKALEARNAAEIAQLREAARRQNEIALQRRKSEHAAEQAKAAAKAAESVAAAEKLSEDTQAQKTRERQAQNATMLAALKAALAAKQAELAAKEKASNGAAAAAVAAGGTGSGTRAPPSSQQQQQQLSAQDKAAVAAAQASADAEVAAVKKANAAALARLKEGYEARRREKEAAAQRNAPSSRASSALQTPTRGLSKVSSSSSFSTNAVSPAEQSKLDEEDQKLREEAEKAARIYEEETELMVANREAGRSLTAVPPPATAATVSAEAVAALSRTATQAQRARDAENGRHSMAVKQLEAKHEQAVRLMKVQHDKAVSATAAVFQPRQHASFTTQLNARRRSWAREHPAPSMEMPTLTPIPTLPAATMSATMAAASMPDAAEQAKIVKTRLAQTREELQRRFDREVQALQKGKEAELAEWQTRYRTARLAEVQQAVTALKAAKAAEVEKAKADAKVRATTAATTAAAAATASATAAAAAAAAGAQAASARREAAAAAAAAAAEKLQSLEAKLRTAEASSAQSEEAATASIAALTRDVAALESSLLTLTQEVNTEEKVREEHRANAAAVAAETEVLLRKSAEMISTPIPAAAAASPSTSFYIDDAAAAAEEAALRSRWATLLASLRSAVHREMEAYERALAETAKAQAAGAASAEVAVSGAAGGALPPTVPVSAAGYGGFATPLQRPPPSSTGDYRSHLAETGAPVPEVRLFSSTPQLQQQQQYYALQQSWANTSGSAPTEHGYSVSPTGAVAAVGQRYYDAGALVPPRGSTFNPHARPSPSSTPYAGGEERGGLYASQLLRQPTVESAHLPGQRSAGQGSGFAGDADDADDYAMRLVALQQAVRERRHELQAQRHDLERLRAEWKDDMRRCRERDDKAEAQKLRTVKDILEERAHRLNAAVVEVKAMQHEVEKDVRRYRQWTLQPQEQQRGEGSRYSAGNTSAAYPLGSEDREWEPSPYGGRYSSGSTAAAASTASVVGLLEGIVARTERLENLMMRRTHATSDHTPSPGRDNSRR